MGRRDKLIAGLAGELVASREREGVLREQNAWLRAAMTDDPATLRLVDGCSAAFEYAAPQAPRRSAARLTSR
jgi:hypothetical protein